MRVINKQIGSLKIEESRAALSYPGWLIFIGKVHVARTF